MFKERKIGIIGGAGAMAGVVLTRHIIEKAQLLHGCYKDDDFPQLLSLNVPFAEMLGADSQTRADQLVQQQLAEAIDFLLKNEVDKILIACNTLHYYLPPQPTEKLVHLVEATKALIATKSSPAHKFLLLSSYLTSQSALYNHPNIVKVNAKDQKVIHDMILKIMAGQHGYEDKRMIDELFLAYQKEDPTIKHLLLGCTEFSVLYQEYSWTPPTHQPSRSEVNSRVIDPLEIASEMVLETLLKG